MANFNLDDYEPVSDRITRFWQDHPEGRILTELVHRDDQQFIVKASIWRRNLSLLIIAQIQEHTAEQIASVIESPDTTGYAQEIIGSSNVNRTSALENCETSAIGRALANLGYAVKNRASREEMEKVQTRERPRQAGKKVIPTPANGNLKPEEAIRIATLKKDLLAKVEGNQEEARELWRRGLEMFGLTPQDMIPADLIGPLETAMLDQFAQDRLLEVPE